MKTNAHDTVIITVPWCVVYSEIFLIRHDERFTDHKTCKKKERERKREREKERKRETHTHRDSEHETTATNKLDEIGHTTNTHTHTDTERDTHTSIRALKVD